MRGLTCGLGLIAMITLGACARSRTRAEMDASNRRRDCRLPNNGGPAEEHAVRCAEWFIAAQGYTLVPVTDTAAVVGEGIEWTASVQERLAARRGSLQPRAFGICVGPDGFDVAFYHEGGQSARGVTMDKQFRSLRVEHSNFNPDAVRDGLAGCRSLPRDTTSRHDTREA